MILITGANGFLGSYISKRLKEDGHSVLNYGRDKLDVLNKLSVERVILDNNIKCVIHTAIKGGRRTREDTAQDFYNNLFMFENLVAHRDKFDFMINFGSGAAFDRSGPIDCVRETDVLNKCPVDYYGLSKNIIAKRIYAINDNIYNFRIFNCFGEHELNDRMIKANCINLLNNDDLIVHANKMMDFFYIEDVYKTVKHYLTHNQKLLPIDVNLCYEKKNDLIGIANLINNLTERSCRVKLGSKEKKYSYTGSGVILSSLNIDFIGIETGILNTINFLDKKRKNKNEQNRSKQAI